MYYLVNCDTLGCVDFQAIVGIAFSRSGIYEILLNYFCMMECKDASYRIETDKNDIQIFEINENDYNYLKNKYDEYLDKIYDSQQKYKNCLKMWDQYSYFWWGVLVLDEEDFTIYDKKFHRKYNRILERSQLILRGGND